MTTHVNSTSLIQPELTSEKRLRLVRQWGSSTSDAILDPFTQIFTIPAIDGLIGYRLEYRSIVVFGDPVCSPEDLPSLVTAFHEECKKNGYNIIYVSASESFAKWAIQNTCRILIKFGKELYLDPFDDPKRGPKGGLVRRKVRHAIKEGTTVQEYLPHDPQLENALEKVGQQWLQGRRGLQIHISHVRIFENRTGKRWFYAKQGDRCVGLLVLNQLKAKQGWHLNHVMIVPDAPHGTPEFLVTTALEKLKEEDCRFVTFGAVPTEHLNEILGLGRFSKWLAQSAFKISRKIFKLDGRKKFWEKFQPNEGSSSRITP
jgi:lysylphosphatidylglycerol synthetase-like protein (DUF2156 family)